MRQSEPQPIDPKVKPARGLLHRTTSFEHFELTRFEPSEDLSEHVEHHWMVLHDLGDRPPYMQKNLSHPSQHTPRARPGCSERRAGCSPIR